MRRHSIYPIALRLVLLLGFAGFWLQGFAQDVEGNNPAGPAKGNRIEIETTDIFHFATFGKDSLRIRKLLGNVTLRQDTTVLFCDSAYQFLDSNFIEAFGRVKIVMNDHMPDSMRRTITAHKLTFDGNSKIINFWENVVLTDRKVVLRTPRLTYYRIADFAEYLQGGEITNEDNVLRSKKGYYYPKSDMAYFKDRVRLDNPSFKLATDTLGYNTESKVAFFLAPTWVNDSVNTMYTEDGYYDTERDFAFLHQNASIGDTTYTLFADTIQYDQGRDLGKALGHIRLEQLDSSLTVFGKYGEFRSKTEATFVTDSAFAIQKLDKDTLFLFADTLSTYKDTTENKRFFMAYGNSSFLTADMQGVCDSLVYWYDDSLMFFYQAPALWSEASQITGDTIIVKMRDGSIDSMSIPANPFIITEEDTVGFDQIKGKHLYAKFLEKRINKMWIFGNSESIYYTKDDKENYMGMNQARCSDMYITFADNKPSKILFKEKPEGEFYPIFMVLYKENLLDGFVWRKEERPVRPLWIDDIIYRQAMLRDPFRLRMDTLLWALEDVEFDIWNLLKDSIYTDFGDDDSAWLIPEGGIVDTLALDSNGLTLPVDSAYIAYDLDTNHVVTASNIKPTKGTKGPGKANAGQDSALRKLTKDERRNMNFKQLRVYHKKRKRALKAIRDQKKAAKAALPKVPFKERWKKFKKGLKERPTKAEIAAKEEEKINKVRKRVDRKAMRMKMRHQRYMLKKSVHKVDGTKPKDAEFNNVELRKRR